MTNISIRQYHDFKPEELFAIIRHIYLTSGFMSDDFDSKFGSVKIFGQYFDRILKQRGSFVQIALMDERPVGYLVVEANPALRLQHTASLNMGLVENARGKGIGNYLLQAALKQAQQEHILEIIYLMVRADHVGAINLYKKAGFEILAKLEKDTKIGNEYFDGILMRRVV